VPPEHPDSNYGTAAEALLSKISIPPENVHRVRGEARPDEEALRYENEIRETLPLAANGIPRFDWILLGLGTDGHTASLFPGASSLDEKEKLCVTAVHPQSGRKRITFTPILINNAARISFLVTGKEKSEVVYEILTGTKAATRYPAIRIEPLDGHIEWILDEAASSLLA
jgi:6-phosphogluconolactonase